MSAAVTWSISRMPGPPRGPSKRMTTTSPFWISPRSTAAKVASSPSNTRAGPENFVRPCPASFTTQPSGASVPRRMANPPRGFSASAIGRMTRCGFSTASSASALRVRPLTVGASTTRFAPKRRLSTSRAPPAPSMSTAV